jgi:hypothetical protein
MAGFIGYPNRQVLAVLDDDEAVGRAVAGVETAGVRAPGDGLVRGCAA